MALAWSERVKSQITLVRTVYFGPRFKPTTFATRSRCSNHLTRVVRCHKST